MVTALTLTMNLAVFVLTPQQTLIVMRLYTLIGAAGFDEIFGPGGGLLIVFIIAYPLVSYLKGSRNDWKHYLFIDVVVDIRITYIGQR